MLHASHWWLSLGALLLACGSADSSFLTGGGEPIRGTSSGGTAGMAGAPSGGSDSVLVLVGGAPTAGGAMGNGGGAVSSGGGSPFGGGFNQGGAVSGISGAYGSGGIPAGAGGSKTGAGGDGPVSTLPSGGIISPDCSTCAKAHCQTELAACNADAACRTAEGCMTTCSLADCTSCVLAGPVTFSQLFSGCLRPSCSSVCPSVTTG